jgi:hypothetical protein
VSWLGRLIRSLSVGPSETDSRPVRQEEPVDYSTGEFEFHIVGESYRQAALRAVAMRAQRHDWGRLEFPATLRREPKNRHDRNAIAVYAFERTHIGYVSREEAEVMAPYLDRIERDNKVVTCRGIIIGEGRPNLGAILDLDLDRLMG